MDENQIKVEIQLRKINCDLNPLTRPDGSALLTQGETAVLASMYGPIELKPQSWYSKDATIEVYYRPKSSQRSPKDRMLENLIKNICESVILTSFHPRTLISLQLQEMENKSGLIACCINAAILALLIGGAPMKFVASAIHCIIDENDELILDPDSKQAKSFKADFTFVFDSIDNNLISIYTNGKYTKTQFDKALITSKSACKIIFKFYKDVIRNYSSNIKKV